MKRLSTLLLAVLISITAFSQATEKMSYQALVRNNADQLVTNSQIGLQISILQGTSDGTVVYNEVQTPTTNANGLVSIEIGGEQGFDTINWSNGPYFIKTEIAIDAPLTTYTFEGTSQLLSVPYALHAKTAEILFLKSPDGTTYKITVQDDGTLVTERSGFFRDPRDGYEYKTLKIGTQTWMAENLAYLPSVVGPGTGSQTTSYYYVYGYNGTVVADAKATSNYTTYGVLYNWTAAMGGSASSTANPSGVQGVCPAGWHLPSDAEWTELTNHLGGESVAGGKLKETGTAHWNSPNTEATNEFDFTALPGGDRLSNGTFYNIGLYGLWWSSTEYDAPSALYRNMDSSNSSVYRGNVNKELGFSVRCVKD